MQSLAQIKSVAHIHGKDVPERRSLTKQKSYTNAVPMFGFESAAHVHGKDVPERRSLAKRSILANAEPSTAA